MRSILGIAAMALAAAFAVAASAQSELERQQAEWDKLPDTSGTGPYPATIEIDPGLPNQVIYHPADLAPFAGGKLGVFVWGNGACADDGTSARQHLAEIASHGYLVIAPGKWASGPNARVPRSPPRAAGAPPPTTAADLRAAMDWALAAPRFAGLIDQRALAYGGFSCGGVQALANAGDPRIDTVVVQNSGLMPEDAPKFAGMDLPKSALGTLHTPVIYLQGGTTDIAYANGLDDFRRIDNVPAVMVNIPTGHGGTYNQPNGGKGARIVVDWLEWQLRGDAEAAKSFLGIDCRLCVDPDAEIERRNLPGG